MLQPLTHWDREPLPQWQAELMREAFGYVVVPDDYPTIQCAYYPLEKYSAPNWLSLFAYASGYELCTCGHHQGDDHDLPL